MKKIFLACSLFLAVLALTSCLKDKEFDNHTYGINDPDTQPPGVGFPLASAAYHKKVVGVNLSSDPQDVEDVVFVNLESTEPAASDVHVTIVVDDNLRLEYNDSLRRANGDPDYPDTLSFLPTDLYSFPLSLTIPAGERNVSVPINVVTTSTIDPSGKYGIGVSITSVDGNYTIAQNLSNLIVEFNIKNQYHGTYHSTGYLYHPSSPRPIDEEKEVLTAGPTSVTVGLGDLGGSGYTALINIDPVTNKLTITAAPGAAGGPYIQFDSGLPSTNPGYTPQWSGSAASNNTYDPVTHTFHVRYGYVGGTGYRVTEEAIVLQ